jgi:hypothetical protein
MLGDERRAVMRNDVELRISLIGIVRTPHFGRDSITTIPAGARETNPIVRVRDAIPSIARCLINAAIVDDDFTRIVNFAGLVLFGQR